jgi:hypothetical protein
MDPFRLAAGLIWLLIAAPLMAQAPTINPQDRPSERLIPTEAACDVFDGEWRAFLQRSVEAVIECRRRLPTKVLSAPRVNLGGCCLEDNGGQQNLCRDAAQCASIANQYYCLRVQRTAAVASCKQKAEFYRRTKSMLTEDEEKSKERQTNAELNERLTEVGEKAFTNPLAEKLFAEAMKELGAGQDDLLLEMEKLKADIERQISSGSSAPSSASEAVRQIGRRIAEQHERSRLARERHAAEHGGRGDHDGHGGATRPALTSSEGTGVRPPRLDPLLPAAVTWLGVALRTSQSAAAGALVTAAAEDGIASREGLRSGDVIYRIAGEAVTSAQEAARLLERAASGNDTVVNFKREGKPYLVRLPRSQKSVVAADITSATLVRRVEPASPEDARATRQAFGSSQGPGKETDSHSSSHAPHGSAEHSSSGSASPSTAEVIKEGLEKLSNRGQARGSVAGTPYRGASSPMAMPLQHQVGRPAHARTRSPTNAPLLSQASRQVMQRHRHSFESAIVDRGDGDAAGIYGSRHSTAASIQPSTRKT